MAEERTAAPSPAGYATLVVRGRWVVLALVAVGDLPRRAQLPGLAGSQAGLSGLVGQDNPAITAQIDAVQRFGLPLLSRTVVVQHDPDGLDPFVQADIGAAGARGRQAHAGRRREARQRLRWPTR